MGDRLAELLLRWEEAWEHGNDIPASQLCEDHPDLLEELQAKINDLKKMAWMTKEGVNQVPDETDELISRTLGGRYHIESLIAYGGFGRVYKSFDPELERHVAVKVPHRPDSNGDVNHLVDEARRVAKLRHPGIVAVHDVGTDDGTCFIVSDLIDGRSLARLIAEDRPSVKDSVLLVARIADTLQAAHDEGFIHRDIKPANILIDATGNPLLTDFGIATTGEDLASGANATSGTLPYMSPEQVAGEAQLVDSRTDIYSLGVVLYELLTGQSPYHARTPGALREQILFRMPQPVRRLNAVVTSATECVCQKCLSKHPADRFASASELASALRSSLTARDKNDSWKWLLAGVLALTLIAGAFVLGKHYGQLETRVAQSDNDSDAFVFDGDNRIVTPLERFAPVTLEAWVRPDHYKSELQMVIGSDIAGEFGIGMGLSPPALSAEIIRENKEMGLLYSNASVPIRKWSHVAVVFGTDETRMYFNGELAGTGQATVPKGGTNFVIGNIGDTTHMFFFHGKMRSIRISKGERFDENFIPDDQLNGTTDSDSSVETLLVYEATRTDGERVLDISGHKNHGSWQRFDP